MPAAAAATAAAMTLQVILSTAQVTDLLWHEDTLWAATGGGVEVWSPTGTRLAHLTDALPRAEATALGTIDGRVVIGTSGGAIWQDPAADGWVPFPNTTDAPIAAVLPQGVLTRSGWLLTPGGLRVDLRPPGSPPVVVTDAVSIGNQVVLGTLGGEVILYGEGVVRRALPGPVADLSITPEGTVRVAWTTGAGTLDPASGALQIAEGIAASGAGSLWGGVDGRLLDAKGTVARLPAPVRATLRLPDADGTLVVATDEGLYGMSRGAGLQRWTPEGQICGNFITGITRWQGALVVSTFDRGACMQQPDGSWRMLAGLPGVLLNAVLVDGEDLLVASAEGLARVQPDGTVSVTGLEVPGAGRSAPGLHHLSVTGLAHGGDRLWITDLAGPIAVDGRGRWRRYRYHVWSTSNQRIAACGRQAWVATEDAGVGWFDGVAWKQVDALTGLPDDWIMAVACTGEGQGYAGTYQDGVWQQQPDGAWRVLPGLPDDWILSLATGEDAVWAGTMGGLFRWNATEAAWTPGSTGLPDPRVHALLVEEDAVWVGTERGLVEVGGSAERLSHHTP